MNGDARADGTPTRCLVTGGAGFVGAHLVRELARRGPPAHETARARVGETARCRRRAPGPGSGHHHGQAGPGEAVCLPGHCRDHGHAGYAAVSGPFR